MRQLRASGSVYPINQSSSTKILEQVADIMAGVEDDVTQVISEYNSEVYTVLSSLSQGRNDSRFKMTDDSINPKVNNLDGANLFLHTDASTVSNGGRYFRTDLARPKTIKESLDDLHTLLSSNIDTIRSEVGTSSTSSGSGISTLAKARIGNAIFDEGVSSSTSLDGKTSANQARLLQLAKDIYDEASGWSWTGDGSGFLNNYSVKDMLSALLTLHQGAYDVDITLNHSALGVDNDYSRFSIALNGSTTAGVETVVGTINFDPSEYDGALTGYVTDSGSFTQSTLHLQLEVVIGLLGTGTAPATAYLYDMGSPGSLGAGNLISTLDSSAFSNNTTDKASVSLAVADEGASLTWSSDEILNQERIYEMRILVGPGGTAVAGDTAYIGWGGFTVTDNNSS